MPTCAPISGPEQIEPIVRKLTPDVVRVVLRNGPDWPGDPAIYVRVLLSDDAVREDRPAEVTARVRGTIFDEPRPGTLDRIPYFRFRGASEQARLREKAWE